MLSLTSILLQHEMKVAMNNLTSKQICFTWAYPRFLERGFRCIKGYRFTDLPHFVLNIHMKIEGVQWLSGRVLDSRPRGSGFEPHRRHCVVSLSKNINPSLVQVQPRKTPPFITERLLMGRKESNKK